MCLFAPSTGFTVSSLCLLFSMVNLVRNKQFYFFFSPLFFALRLTLWHSFVFLLNFLTQQQSLSYEFDASFLTFDALGYVISPKTTVFYTFVL